jgi:putative FmdB family regulatory protein
MPRYEYECKKCNHIFTRFRPMRDSSKTAACPCCGCESNRKITAPGGFILKGKGFYKNDYGNRKTKAP